MEATANVDHVMAFKKLQRDIHGPELVPDEAFEDNDSGGDESVLQAIATAVSAPRSLTVQGVRIVVDEPTVGDLKRMLAEEIDWGELKGLESKSIVDQVLEGSEAVITLVAGFIEHPEIEDIPGKAQWLQSLKLSEALVVAEAVSEVCNLKAMFKRAKAIMGKLRGVPGKK